MPETPHRVAQRRAAVPLLALFLAIALLSLTVAAAGVDHGRERDAQERALISKADEQAEKLEHYFSRARSLTLVTARNPAFRDFYAEPGARRAKVVARGRSVMRANEALSYLEELFPGSIGEACFIDRSGPENARAVRGKIAPLRDLSPDESKAPFFKPTFALRPGQVYQARPYLSPDTNEWVVANATPVATGRRDAQAIVHFEVSLESFRAEAAESSDRFDVAIVEAESGTVVADTRYRQPQGVGSTLGRPADRRLARVAATVQDGTMDVSGRPSALRRLNRDDHNANNWIVVASAKAPRGTLLSQFGILEGVMALAAFVLLGFALFSFRASQARLRSAAMTDSLTGLPNRRALMADLERSLPAAMESSPLMLALFDLDGFKSYNDGFGHPAGDALLERLGSRLAAVAARHGSAYRMGGDEFCVLAHVDEKAAGAALEAAGEALSEHGEGFGVTASHGAVMLPAETIDVAEALRIADQRMYASKSSGRTSAARQATDALVRVLAERDPDLGEHLDGVARLCTDVGERLGLATEEVATLRRAASLHDIGKAAIPDAIIDKPGPLGDDEWAFMRQHTLIGERILGAAPALASAAKLVRSSHEWMDGSGYPDGLKGEEIPLGARIVAVCDAYDAMTSIRPYRRTPMSEEGAIAELRRQAGTQFDPAVVEAFCAALAERGATVIVG